MRTLAAILLAALAAACVALPTLDGRDDSTAFSATGDTRLGRAFTPRVAQHPGKSGIYALADSGEAFALRVLLARASERSLDVQYYIWKNDVSGGLLLQALQEAADRGVRVRLLLDDNNTDGLDAILAALDAHPNVEVRLFNPLAIRSPRWAGYLVEFARLNRRMHNKSFTADNQATIIGGRNVGDQYFDAGGGALFVDLDVLAVGPVVREVSADFDRYWASASSYPVDRLLPHVAGPLRFDIDTTRAGAYVEAVRKCTTLRDLLAGALPFEWATTRMVSDNPAKALGRSAARERVAQQLRDLLGPPASSLDVVSAYFVPATTGTDIFVDMARRGVSVRVLTNSLEATDVALVHAGYAKRRRALLEAGVKLYELRRLGPARKASADGVGSSVLSASSLHAKAFSVDRMRVFIGSLNFDPRSSRLNTEMGFLIDSPSLAASLPGAFEGRMLDSSYEVRLSDAGEMYWIERDGARQVRHATEPGTDLGRRIALWLLSLLPIDWLL